MAKTKRNPSKQKNPICVLFLSLLDSNPLVWRRIQLSGTSNLGFLHAVIQIAMGWTNSHLHHFIVGKRFFMDPELREGDDMGVEYGDSYQTMLSQVAPKKNDFFLYEYDFGDSWMHEIRVEEILPQNDKIRKTPVCLAGKNACPPEDCMGIGGYEDLLKTLKNPKSPEYKETMEWLGGSFDPEKFDINKINKYLKLLKKSSPSQDYISRILMNRDGVH